jgi:hypothetical protein
MVRDPSFSTSSVEWETRVFARYNSSFPLVATLGLEMDLLEEQPQNLERIFFFFFVRNNDPFL